MGPAILISNHTCGIDHMLLQSRSRRLLGFMVAREYYEWKWIHWICKYIGCIPVNRDGRDFAATRAAMRALKAGRVLPIFPEGHIVPASGRRLDRHEARDRISGDSRTSAGDTRLYLRNSGDE